MPMFLKRPVTVEAIQWTGANVGEIFTFITRGSAHYSFDDQAIFVKTLEGTMRADKDDWIVKGVAGEFYACKPDIFNITYEPA